VVIQGTDYMRHYSVTTGNDILQENNGGNMG
jgi:hypothetical protein